MGLIMKLNRFSEVFVPICMVIYLAIAIWGLVIVVNYPEDFTFQTKPVNTIDLTGLNLSLPEISYNTHEEIREKLYYYRLYWAFNVVYVFLTLYFHKPTLNKFNRLGDKIMKMIK